MVISERVRERLEHAGLSQSELARRVGVTQTTIAKLALGTGYGSKHLHRIARELKTTPAYLTGETDDPGADAPPPQRSTAVQQIMMPVTLPSQKALTRMFEAFFLALDPAASQEERAESFARWLPIGLSQLQDLLPDDHAQAVASTRREMAEVGALPRRGAR